MELEKVRAEKKLNNRTIAATINLLAKSGHEAGMSNPVTHAVPQ